MTFGKLLSLLFIHCKLQTVSHGVSSITTPGYLPDRFMDKVSISAPLTLRDGVLREQSVTSQLSVTPNSSGYSSCGGEEEDSCFTGLRHDLCRQEQPGLRVRQRI